MYLVISSLFDSVLLCLWLWLCFWFLSLSLAQVLLFVHCVASVCLLTLTLLIVLVLLAFGRIKKLTCNHLHHLTQDYRFSCIICKTFFLNNTYYIVLCSFLVFSIVPSFRAIKVEVYDWDRDGRLVTFSFVHITTIKCTVKCSRNGLISCMLRDHLLFYVFWILNHFYFSVTILLANSPPATES